MDQDERQTPNGVVREEEMELTSHCQDLDGETSTLHCKDLDGEEPEAANLNDQSDQKLRHNCVDGLRNRWCFGPYRLASLRRFWFVQEVLHITQLAVPAVGHENL